MGGNRNKPLRILYSPDSPGPTNFFNAKKHKFLNAEIVADLVNSGVVKIAIEDIPYIILLNEESGRFYDTTRSVFISEDEAKRLTDSELGVILRKNNKPPRILFCPNNTGPTNFFSVEKNFHKDKQVAHLINSRVGEIVLEKKVPIPYIILLSPESGTFYDTTRSVFICKDEAKRLSDSGRAEIRISLDNRFTERLLIGATAATGTTAIAATAASVPFAMGFTSGGVAAGSAAAAIQSGIGSVAAGSGFAIMQSIAATTVLGTAFPMVVAGAAIAGAAASGMALHKHFKGKRRD